MGCCNQAPPYDEWFCACPAGCNCMCDGCCCDGQHVAELALAGGLNEVFGPAEKLHAAIRRIVPQAAVSLVRDEEAGLTRVRVVYRHRGPLVLGWDGATYRRWSPSGFGAILPPDAEDAARRAAEMVGAQIPTAERRP